MELTDTSKLIDWLCCQFKDTNDKLSQKFEYLSAYFNKIN